MHTFFFFFNDTATTEIYTLSLHDALPIYGQNHACRQETDPVRRALKEREKAQRVFQAGLNILAHRSEEHTSELQSRPHLVCRLLLEKKKKNNAINHFLYLIATD